MQKVAELSEDDLKLAVEFWMYNKHSAVIASGKSISFSVSNGDRPGDRTRIAARVEYHDDPGPNP